MLQTSSRKYVILSKKEVHYEECKETDRYGFVGYDILSVCYPMSWDECGDIGKIKYPACSRRNGRAKELGRQYYAIIEGENGVIRAWAKNIFTLFPAVVRLDVELYSSDTYQSTYTEMELEKRASTPDLDQGHTLEVSVPTNGEQKYWRARVHYSRDGGDWISKETDTLLYSPEGELIPL